LATFFAVFFFTNPETGTAGIILFSVSLFLGCLGLFTLLGFWFRTKRQRRASERIFRASLRQGFFMAIFIVVILFLYHYQSATPSVISGVALAIIIIELSIMRISYYAAS